MSYQENNAPLGNTAGSLRPVTLRVRIVLGLILAFFALVGLRLAQVQVVDYQKYRGIAQKQYQAKVDLPAARGTLTDRNGAMIASNTSLVSYAADPKLAADDARAIARRFSKLFGKPAGYYLEKLRSDSRFVWLERLVSVSSLKKIDPHEFDGLVVRYEPKRLYHDQVAGQLIGSTDLDNKGIAGIESKFDADLHGVEGCVIFQRDGLGRARPSVDFPRVEPVNGSDISLTIDMEVQQIAEQELKKGVDQFNADGGITIIMRPGTGEILAMAQCPTVDPNNFKNYPLEQQRLRAVTDLFEPGSVFKIVTASAALENKLVAPERRFFAENGTYVVPVLNSKPRTIVDTHKEGWITFMEAMEFSSNIVMAKVSDIVGSERLYKMARDYGFGIPTNIELPGEVNGVLKKPADWSATTLNTIAFGYEVGVTPLQIATAYAAVANGGMLMKPYIFARETDQAGLVVRSGQPEQIRRVISPATARTLTGFFEGVVTKGTGKPAAIPGVKIAGKTGTSKKMVQGHYEQGSYTASFVGFFPSDDPRILCLVMLDNPRGGNYTGGATSAPVFRAIAQRLLNRSELFAPAVPNNQVIVKNTPRTGGGDERDRDETVAAAPDRQVAAAGIVPDVRGFSLRRAVNLLGTGKLVPVVNGSGVVVSQSPAGGSSAKPGMRVLLTCQSKSAAFLGN
ncbi:MAG TPA: penicillin-binding protein 2 [Bacteroidota bacterium]|jgi:cell division protein FtsI (penicillin-binding protein 3)